MKCLNSLGIDLKALDSPLFLILGALQTVPFVLANPSSEVRTSSTSFIQCNEGFLSKKNPSTYLNTNSTIDTLILTLSAFWLVPIWVRIK